MGCANGFRRHIPPTLPSPRKAGGRVAPSYPPRFAGGGQGGRKLGPQRMPESIGAPSQNALVEFCLTNRRVHCTLRLRTTKSADQRDIIMNSFKHPACLAMAACVGLATLVAGADKNQQAKSEWVYPGPDGKLVYKMMPPGDKIMDFSHAGYMGGGVKLPSVPVKETVKPTGNDDTAAIQAALDAVAKLPLTDGFRGAVLLAPGTFACSGTLKISASGVVLRGSGSEGNQRSTLKLTGKPRNAITVDGKADNVKTEAPAKEAKTTLADKYVPSGAKSLVVTDGSGFAAGDIIAIRKPVTADWVKFMQMDDLVRDGKKQTWLPVGRKWHWPQ